MKTLHLNCVPFLYKIVQASNANESESECSKTVLCITEKDLRMLSRGNTRKPLKCDRVANLKRKFTQFRPSEIHYQPDPTARNSSLDM